MERASDIPSDDALETMRFNWGEVYEIEVTDDGWRARRRDGLGGWITAPSAHDLRDQIVSDYLVKPVTRPSVER